MTSAILSIPDFDLDAIQMGISGKSPAKMGGEMKGDQKYDAELHPRYPKGHPKGGEFMPKGSKEQVQAIAKAKGVSTDKAAAMVKAKPQPITKNEPLKFSSASLAHGFADKATKSMAVMKGDDNKFWVVTMADSQRLEKAGYKYADRPKS